MSCRRRPPRELADGKLLIDEPAAGVVRLTISNPAKRNALDHPILDAITATLARARAAGLDGALRDRHRRARHVLGRLRHRRDPRRGVRGARRAARRAPVHAKRSTRSRRSRCPTLAVLPGHTIGGGLELALACDLRVAQDGIKLGMPPAKLGLVYSHTGLRRFIDAIGAARTRELFLLGRYIDAPTALAWGLVNRVAAAERARARWRSSSPPSWPATRRSRRRGNKRVIARAARAPRAS